MSENLIQASFNSGEWSPQLFARVDLQKYRSGAALLQNFFVDYRGGASTRAGTHYVLQCLPGINRLIPFQAAFNVGYILAFSNDKIRFIFQDSPVLENGFAITGATQANPAVLTVTGNNFAVGDWVFVSGVVGMTQLNGRYFIVGSVSGAAVGLKTLDGVNLNSTGYTAYVSGGTVQRVYTIASPYAAADLALLKFTQSTTEMIICHPSYTTQVLKLISATNWTINPIQIGSTCPTPTNIAAISTLPSINIYVTPPQFGSSYYAYVYTAIDAAGQESLASPIAHLGPLVDIRTFPGSNLIQGLPVVGAVAYNFYEAEISYFGPQPTGVFYGFIGNSFQPVFIDSNIAPDFSQSPPISQNPFVGTGVQFVTVTTAGVYTTVPSVTFTGGTPVVPASAFAQLQIIGTPTITAGGSGFVVGDTVGFGHNIVMSVTGVSSGAITSWSVQGPGAITSGTVPTNPIPQVATTGAGTGATMTATWGVGQVVMNTIGSGYVSAPTVGFSAGAAAATATLSPTGNGNPSVPSFFQQRLVLAGTLAAPATFWMSQIGSPFNFNTHLPIEADDAIQGTLVANTLNTIKSIVSVPAGMLIFTDQAAWVVTGGFVSQGIAGAVSPETIVAGAQSFIGANDMPPIVANYDILFVESNGSKVRDLAYNIYFNVFTGTDISITASHLFYGFNLTEWTWAEEPFYQCRVVRNDGTLLSLTFLKEQEFAGWSHFITQGSYLSVASITEPSQLAGTVNAVYYIIQRSINGVPTNYIEREVERVFPAGLADAWCVDSALKYTGAPTASFTGAEHLRGTTVTGLADGVVIPPFVMPQSGDFTLSVAASNVVVGLGYTCDLQTLALDMGEPTIQGKVKKIASVNVRVNQTLGLKIGAFFSTLTLMKDMVQGNVSSMLTGQPVQIVNGLYSGDASTYLDPTYTVPGRFCIRQDQPLPATILGVIPSITIGDDK